METIFEDFLAAADGSLVLLESGEVAARWAEPSACQGFTVGGLAAHLAWQVQAMPWVLSVARPGAGAAVTDLTGHYAGAEWIGAGLEAPVNAGIRDRGEERASGGSEEVVRLTRAARDEVAEAFESLEPDAVVAVPWIEGRAMTLGDLLTTRVLEMLIHSDDLAVSVEVEAPGFTASAYGRVVGLLTSVSVRRHGPVAVMRALSRPQRAPESIVAL